MKIIKNSIIEMKINNPIIEMKINKADFNEQDILVFPNNRRAPENLSSVIKFLFGDAAVATEYYVDNFSFLKITGADYILKDVKTLNADFIVKEVKTREVIK